MNRQLLNRHRLPLVVITTLLLPAMAAADGVIVHKVYDPYVQPLETELEWRLVDHDNSSNPVAQLQSLGFGRSLSDRVAIEAYAIAQKGPGEHLSVDTYELEVKWQLTEQGEYAVDWGLLFELERGTEENAWDLSTYLLAARDFGRVTAMANLGLIYEQGAFIRSEFETTLRAQVRYRLKEIFEPAIELHMGEDTQAIGPAITGLVRMPSGKKLRWELGVFAGLDNKSPDQTIKANLEFEF